MFQKTINRTISQGFLWVLMLVAFSLPLIRSSWHGIILGIAILMQFHQFKHITYHKDFKVFGWLVILYTILNLIGLIYSSDIGSGFSFIETQLPIFILPLVLFSFSAALTADSIIKITISFIAGVILLNLACLLFISHNLWDYRNLQANLVLANYSLGQIHPTFLSLYISVSIFFIIDRFFPISAQNRSKLGWILFSLLILIAYLLWINSRTGIVSFIVAALFYFLYKFEGKVRWIALSGLAIFLSLILIIPFSRERFVTSPLQVWNSEVALNDSDPNVFPLLARRDIYQCSFDIIKGPEFFYGYGTGDFRKVLQQCYQSKGFEELFKSGLDSHSEYFAQLHRHGILGLMVFMSMLIASFYYALKKKSSLLAVFILLFAFTAAFETVFSSQKGATLFALFYPLFIILAQKTSQERIDLN